MAIIDTVVSGYLEYNEFLKRESEQSFTAQESSEEDQVMKRT